MMDKELIRIFPRYNIPSLKASIQIEGLRENSFYVKDISLGGLQIYSQGKLTLNNFNQVDFCIGKEFYKINIFQVWQEDVTEVKEENKVAPKQVVNYRSGYRVKFIEKESFRAWKKLILALHLHQEKKIKR